MEIPLECEECDKPLDPNEAVWVIQLDLERGKADADGFTSIPMFREVPPGTDMAVPFHRDCLEARRKRQSQI